MPRGSSIRKRKATLTDDTFGDATTPKDNEKRRVIRRKKQGVTKTNSAAVKALIRLNQANSPLLKLAPEIREKILTYLVGGQVLHLFETYVQDIDTDVALENGTKHDKSPRAAVRYLICQADTTEAYDYHDRNVAETMSDDPALYHCENCGKGHEFCRQLVKITKKRQMFQLSLNVLGVGRQLYEEANHLLWSTNTFRFYEPVAFELFFGSLNPAQKRNLAKLSFSDHRLLGGWGRSHTNWIKVLQPANLKMLQGLTTLSLCFQLFVFGLFPRRPSIETVKSQFWENMQEFVQFRMLPLKRVFVTIADDQAIWLANNSDLMNTKGDQQGEWTAVERKQFAREWEDKLLDADPVSTLEAEEDAEELEAREAHIQTLAKMIKAQQGRADAYKAEADAAAANLEEAKKEPARVSSAMQVSIQCIMKTREEAVAATSGIAYDSMLYLEMMKASLPTRIEEQAAKRQAQREIRKKRQMTIMPRAGSSIRPAIS